MEFIMFGYSETSAAEWRPASGSTPGTASGCTFTSTGTVTHPTLTSSNLQTQSHLQTQSRRTRFTSGTSANDVAGLRSDSALTWIGSGAANAGFCFVARFSLSANPSTGRAFVGLSATSETCASDPSGTANTIGIGFDSGDSSSGNWKFMTKSATTLTKFDLGDAAPRNTTDVYLLILRAMPNASEVGVHVFNLSTKRTVLKGFVSTNLPDASAFLYPQAEVGIGSGGAAISLDVLHLVLDKANEGVFDVRDFGALGDGTTDDSDAFHAALAATWPNAVGSGIVLVPPGTYRLASNLDITRHTLLMGVGGGGQWCSSVLKFDQGFGIVVHGIKTFPPAWTANTVMTLDSVVRRTIRTSSNTGPSRSVPRPTRPDRVNRCRGRRRSGARRATATSRGRRSKRLRARKRSFETCESCRRA
jgi:hypothetical protein